MDIDTVVQEKIDGDTDFQSSLEGLSDEDKTQAINIRKSELVKSEFDSLNKKAQENEQKFKDQQARAFKAEEELKKGKPAEIPPEKKSDDLSSKDLYALMEAKVPQEDVEEVQKAAKLLGKTVSEALKDDLVKTRLSQLAEFRKTADATTTGQQRRVATKVTDDALLDKVSKGEIPEKGTEEAERYFWAKRGVKK
jgi:hypothetical protein